MNLRGLMERHLPCPPDPTPEPGTDAWYLWRATLFNAYQRTPLHIVKLPKYESYRSPSGVARYGLLQIVQVECGKRGRGVRVL